MLQSAIWMAVKECVDVGNLGLEALKAGAAFWRGAEDTEAAEAEWQARRSISAADWKSKRRAALKHAPGRNVKPRQRVQQ